MLRGILIGLDGSQYSAGALELAIGWARRHEALLVGLGVVDEPSIRRSEPVPLGGDAYREQSEAAQLARARRQVEQLLEQFALRCAAEGVAYKVLEDEGSPSERIVLQAQRYDLVVLGQQTYFQFATHEGPCQTLQQVLKNAPRPVVAVPEKPAAGAAVLIAYDGSLQSARALYAFATAGLEPVAALHVVSVGEDHLAAARQADRAVEYLRLHGVAAQPHVQSPEASTAATILAAARRLDAGLLVMGAYGQPTLREFFLGSVTRTLLAQSTLPLFLYH